MKRVRTTVWWVRLFRSGTVPQIFNLLYRRIAFGRSLEAPVRVGLSHGPQTANLPYSRLKICATGCRCCGAAILLAVGGWCVFTAVPAQPPLGAGMTKGFKFKDYDPQNRLKSVLSGKEARAQGEDRILITGLHVETYREDGQVDLIVESPECVYDRKSKVASSSGSVEAHSADGRFFISGVGFEWRQTDAHLVLSNRVHTILSKQLLNPTPSNP